MGQIPHLKLIVLISCFLLAGVLLNFKPPTNAGNKKKISLVRALAKIPGWQLIRVSPIEPRLVHALQLDDYINATFSNGKETLSLYIGYYLSSKKIGAAHDPMVCLPGQGWNLSGLSIGVVYIARELMDDKEIIYSSMVASRRENRLLVVYWFQSGEKTSPNTFGQKIDTFVNKILNKPGENALVRVTMELGHMSQRQGEAVIKNFITAFYPVFFQYIQNHKKH